MDWLREANPCDDAVQPLAAPTRAVRFVCFDCHACKSRGDSFSLSRCFCSGSFEAMKPDDGSRTINARVPADVYRAIEAMTGGPLGVTQAQVIRMLIAEALAHRTTVPNATDGAAPGDAASHQAPATVRIRR